MRPFVLLFTMTALVASSGLARAAGATSGPPMMAASPSSSTPLLATPPVSNASMLAAEADVKDTLSQLDTRGSRPLTLSVNPFMGIVGAGVSGNLEYAPVPHVGLIVSPRASVTMPSWVGEAGARYWTSGRRQASGFFVGPALVYGTTRGSALYGVALDCGVQTIFDSGLTLGAGIGVQYLKGQVGNSALEVGPLQGETSVAQAILPRILFSVGYSL